MPDVARPLHLIIVDSWVPSTVARELSAGRLPALAHLVRHGWLDLGCTTVFPSVTPACLTSLATGVGPDRHGITGVLWYNRKADRYVHYWPYPQSIVWGTIDQVLDDFFRRLNGEHLSTRVKTLFEHLEEADVPSACVNFPISRGPYVHGARPPWLLRCLGRLPRELALSGPRYMRHGDMLRADHRANGFFRKFGFNDHQSATFSVELIQKHRPAFMLTYLNENDLRTHHLGPDNIGPSLRKVDAEIGRLMSAYGSWDRAVAEARWLITGDHSQSNTYPMRPGHAVNVFKAFPCHRVCPLGTGGLAAGGYDFAIGPNDRMCYIYLPVDEDARSAAMRETILDLVCCWPSVDQIFWREGSWFHGWRPETDLRLAWRPGNGITDRFGAHWEVRGHLGVVDARLVEGVLRDGDYPNALERVAQALSVPGGGQIVLTAKLGYEFTSGFPMGRGNHGSLHRQDSLVPVLAVGLSTLQLGLRTTDLAGLILRELGVVETTKVLGA